MIIDNPTPDDVFKFFDKVGEKRGNLAMQALRKQQLFVDAWGNPAGANILRYDVEQFDELLTKIIEEKATPQELAEFRYLKKRINRICEIIGKYQENISVVKGQK
jgi:hypothetical protein